MLDLILPRTARPVERACWLVGLALILSGVVHLGVALVDPRPWLGPLSWRKPITFGVSFGTVLISIAWVASYLRLSGRARNRLLGVYALDSVVEVTGITVQAWRHVPSHLNTSSPFDATIAYTLAFGGAVLIVVLGTLAVTAFRGRIHAAPDMALALRAGFALLALGLLAGAAMIVRGTVLIRTGHLQAGYDDAGFLKWFHAVTLHAVLVLPALAWWLRHRGHPQASRMRAVTVAIAGYVAAASTVLIVNVLTMYR